MKRIKKITVLLLALMMTLAMAQIAMAETYDGGTYSYNGSTITNSKANAAIDKEIAGLQPGDEMTFTFTYKNDSDQSTEWYLENTVVKTLEEQSSAANGGYTYELINNGKKEGKVTIFSSSAVAGDENADPDKKNTGLKSATDATGDWLYIDTLAAGQSGTTTLKVALDGESQANNYETTNGQLRINYAVAETPEEDVVVYKTVNTGDETNIALMAAIFLGALALLILAFLSYRKDRKDGEEA